jgi:signal peptidase I
MGIRLETAIKPQPRSILSTILVSFFGSFIAGFLWIGRPKLAAAGIVLTLILLYLVYLFGMPSLGKYTGDIIQWSAVAVSIAAVLLFRGNSVPHGWYSNWFAAIPVALLVSMTLALTIRSLIVQPFSSPSGSMAPALVEGDTFFVNKPAFGYSQHSFPLGIVRFEGRLFPGIPARGDIVVFKSGDGYDYVKRVIGMPGEKIQMKNGAVLINDVAVVQEPTGETFPDEEYASAQIVLEKLPNGVSYKTLDIDPASALDNTPEFAVPEDHLFVLGDNRDNSIDSRLTMGYVPIDNLIGRADRIFANTEGKEFQSRKNLRQSTASNQ